MLIIFHKLERDLFTSELILKVFYLLERVNPLIFIIFVGVGLANFLSLFFFDISFSVLLITSELIFKIFYLLERVYHLVMLLNLGFIPYFS